MAKEMEKKSKTVDRTENSLKNLKRFGKERPPANPTSEQKKAGWERKRQAQALMDKLLSLSDMTLKEFQEMQEDVKRNPDKHTVIEMKLAQYLADKKNTVDFLDRHISKAPQQVELDANITNKPIDLSTLSEDELKHLESIALKSIRPDSD